MVKVRFKAAKKKWWRSSAGENPRLRTKKEAKRPAKNLVAEQSPKIGDEQW